MRYNIFLTIQGEPATFVNCKNLIIGNTYIEFETDDLRRIVYSGDFFIEEVSR